jgi:hypothetical protein
MPAETARQRTSQRLQHFRAAAHPQRSVKRCVRGARTKRRLNVVLCAERQAAQQRFQQKLQRGADEAGVADVDKTCVRQRLRLVLVLRVVVVVAEAVQKLDYSGTTIDRHVHFRL